MSDDIEAPLVETTAQTENTTRRRIPLWLWELYAILLGSVCIPGIAAVFTIVCVSIVYGIAMLAKHHFDDTLVEAILKILKASGWAGLVLFCLMMIVHIANKLKQYEDRRKWQREESERAARLNNVFRN